MKDDKSTILDVISGNESIKFDISISPVSVCYIAGAAIAVGILLIIIAKQIKK